MDGVCRSWAVLDSVYAVLCFAVLTIQLVAWFYYSNWYMHFTVEMNKHSQRWGIWKEESTKSQYAT